MHFAGADLYSRALTDNDVLQAERSLYRVRQDLVAKREELGRLGATDAGSASGRGWIGRVFGGKEDQGGFGKCIANVLDELSRNGSSASGTVRSPGD